MKTLMQLESIILGIVCWFVLSLVVGAYVGGLLKNNSEYYEPVDDTEESEEDLFSREKKGY